VKKQPFELVAEPISDDEQAVWACPSCRTRHESDMQPTVCKKCGYDRRTVGEATMEKSADMVGGFFELVGAVAAEVDNVGVHLPGVRFAKAHIKVGYISRKGTIHARQEAWKNEKEAAAVAGEAMQGFGWFLRKLKGA